MNNSDISRDVRTITFFYEEYYEKKYGLIDGNIN